jgi:hypothetical protein
MNEKRQFKHLGARLRAERPSPSSGLISAIVSRVPERVQHHPKASLRLALAAALAVALVTAVTAVGAVGTVSKQVSHAVVAVKHSVAPTRTPPRPPVRQAPTAAGKQYKGAPVVTGFSPKAACVGQLVVIHGTGFKGTTQVLFGGIAAKFVVLNDSTIHAWVPHGFTGGRVTVVTKKGAGMSPHSLKLKFPGCTRK